MSLGKGTASKTKELPVLADAIASGTVSSDQAAAIASAATVDPTAQGDLLADASESDLSGLRKQALARRCAAEPDPDRRHARQRARRSFRSWVDGEGMGHAHWATTTDELAEMLAALEPFRSAAFHTARRAGRRDPAEMYASDGFLDMARTARDATQTTTEQPAEPGPSNYDSGATNEPKPRLKRPVNMTVLVTNDALLRGYTEAGETCEIEGVGPIPASIARQFLTNDDPFVTILLTDGTDIHRVARPGRRSTAKIKAALDARDRTCVVDGCHARHRLEAHHTTPIAHGGDTRLAALAKLCGHHHDLITNHGWHLTGHPGNWQLTSPDTLQFQDTG